VALAASLDKQRVEIEHLVVVKNIFFALIFFCGSAWATAVRPAAAPRVAARGPATAGPTAARPAKPAPPPPILKGPDFVNGEVASWLPSSALAGTLKLRDGSSWAVKDPDGKHFIPFIRYAIKSGGNKIFVVGNRAQRALEAVILPSRCAFIAMTTIPVKGAMIVTLAPQSRILELRTSRPWYEKLRRVFLQSRNKAQPLVPRLSVSYDRASGEIFDARPL
jgi:hypothetical protein